MIILREDDEITKVEGWRTRRERQSIRVYSETELYIAKEIVVGDI
jgi:hypothetical protein